jgi:hypothetical protein
MVGLHAHRRTSGASMYSLRPRCNFSLVGNIEGGLQVVKGGVLMALGQAIGPLTMNRSRMGRRTRQRSWSLTREMVRIYFSPTQRRGTDAGIV